MPRCLPARLLSLALLAPLAGAQDFPIEIDDPAPLTPSVGALGNAAGKAVAQAGAWLAVGVPGSSNGAGHIDLYEEIDEVWTGPSSLASPTPNSGNGFGRSLDMDGDTLVVGEPQASFPSTGPGRVHVYVLGGSGWTWQATLTAADAGFGDQFGRSVALQGDRLVVGSPYDDEGGLQTGSAYVFDRVATVWTQTGQLSAESPQAGAQFGRSVALDGDTVLVGAWLEDVAGPNSGRGHVFVDAGGGSFSQQAVLDSENGAAQDQMGVASALFGDVALLGAPLADDSGLDSGAVRRFDRDGDSWTAASFSAPFSISTGDGFGASLAEDSGLLVVGAPGEATTGSAVGAVYVFTHDGEVITSDVRIDGPGSVGDDFARTVAVGSEAIAIGAPTANSGAGEGVVASLVRLGFFEDLGFGLAGAAGEPVLSGTGTLIGLTPYSFDLSNAAAGAVSFIVLGVARIDAPFKQGTMVPSINLLASLPVGGDGTVSVGHDEWPNGTPGPFSLYLQWWVQDPSGPEGFTASNALEAVVPPF